ncbi:GNAT family N-acetyltransferase [Sulfitobacter sp. JB4-11]|uniref:GNAT family N-acetyltransferase n=1 Tax=Sulfitobacter rhodophyticola TaxID=3238304 RepID=UPI0035164FBA
MLKTKRLNLRAAAAEDALPLFEVFGSAEAMRYWSWAPHTSPLQTAEFVDMIADTSEVPSYFVVCRDQRPIGTAGFWQGSEVGFVLHPDEWRQGLGEEVLRALIPYGFDTLGLEEITADVDPNNAASIGLLNKLGFVETGRAARTLQIAEDWFDSVYFRLLPSET